MPDFARHTLDSAPDASRTLLRGLKDQVGFVPNLAATMAEAPALLGAFLALRSAAAQASLDPVAREVIAIAVAVETGCSYCVAAHTTFALKQGATARTVELARAGQRHEDARFEALARFTRAVVRRQADVAEQGRALLAAGLTRAQVLEALAAIAVPMLASSVFHVAAPNLDDAFQPQAWLAPA